jgi:hypothetical protein
MFSKLQCGQCGKGMRMFAGADNHCVKLTGAIKDAAKVGILSGLLMHFCGAAHVSFIYVAQSCNVFRRNRLQISAPPAPTTNNSNPELIKAGGCPCGTTEKQPGRNCGTAADERTAGGS